jgi:SAM-dependent methyltransferase
MPISVRDRLLEKLRASLEDGTFAKLTLSRPRDRRADLRNVYARIVELKAGRLISLTLRHATKDVTRNLPFAEAVAQTGSLLADVFEEAHLFATTGDWKLRADPAGAGTLQASRPTFAVAPDPAHDRPKERLLTPLAAPFLTRLGVTNADGAPRPAMADKLRQIERFVELLGHLVDDSPLRAATAVRVFDMGAGKGYLTFATHAFFRQRGVAAEVTGVELRPDLVEQTNRIARELHADGLQFASGTIHDFQLPLTLDILIALHACDTATDDALAAGVRAGAALLVVAPCCQKEIRRQLTPPPELADILRHGILAERQAELLTDGLRALILEAHGYTTRVFEFISPDHTAKNTMIAALRRPAADPIPDPEKLARIHTLMSTFGLTHHHLLGLL